MPVIMFIVDNSASMNQLTYLGTSYLDLAKSAIENFLKIRSRDQMNARNDRYMLLTLDEPPSNIKVGWKEHMTIFTNELKNLKANGLTNLNPVLKQAFDLLNLNRLSSGMDTFGLGRCPFYLEPSLIIFITDGANLMSSNSVYDELSLPLTNSPLGSELINEPFRWDQRFFVISMNMCSIPCQEASQNTFIPYATNSPINSMCEVTGGRSYLISTQRMLYQCLESLVAKIQPGVVLNFEKFGNDPPSIKDEVPSDRLWEKCRKMIFIPRNPVTKGYIIGYWPIPEDFWLSLNSANLPKRSAHPVVKFKCESTEPMTIDEIPFDRYELEPSPLTQYILERRQPNVAWQCFVQNSGSKQNDLGAPFGYLKASSNLMNVYLFVMPYNYPMLFQLITELFQVLKFKPTKAWTEKFEFYLKHIPPYYYGPLRRVLSKKGLQHLIAESLENCLSNQVQSYLKKVKTQAKIDFDRVTAQQTLQIDAIGLLSSNPNSVIYKRQLVDSYADSKEFTSWLQSHMDSHKADQIRQQFTDYASIMLSVREKRKCKQVSLFREPAEIERTKVVEMLLKMRKNFYDSSALKPADEDDLHSLPIQDMGNYHEYLKNQVPPLRELESQMVRQHMFGNPFKLVSKDQKNSLFGADEIDEVFEESAENSNNNQFAQKAQQQFQQAQQALKRGTMNKQRRNMIKGPLSRRHNYLKSLYTQSSTNSQPSSPSPSLSTSTDSDIEMYESSFSISESTLSEMSPTSNSQPDIANMNDFYDANIDMNIQSTENSLESLIDLDEEVKIQFSDEIKIEKFNRPNLSVINQPRAISVSVMSSTSASTSNDLDTNLSSLCDNYLEQSYVQLKILCLEQVKRPGKYYNRILRLINESQLTTQMRLFLIRELIYEASRFKRQGLILVLTKFANLLSQIAERSSVTPTPKDENNIENNDFSTLN